MSLDSLLICQFEETLSHKAPRFAGRIQSLFVLVYMLSLFSFRVGTEPYLSTP